MMDVNYFDKRLAKFGAQFGGKNNTFYTGDRAALIYKHAKNLTNTDFNYILDRLLSSHRFTPSVDDFSKEISALLERNKFEYQNPEIEKEKLESKRQRVKFEAFEKMLIEKMGKETYESTLSKIYHGTNPQFDLHTVEFRRMVLVELEKHGSWGKAFESLKEDLGTIKTESKNNLEFFK